MRRRRILQWVGACAAVLALAAGFIVIRISSRPKLPALTHYGSRPEPFNRALQVAWERADSRNQASDDVRELAHLYQANRLFPEAQACYRVIGAGRAGLDERDHYFLAQIALDQSDLAAALAELRAALPAEPGYLPARLALADVLFKTGQTDAAEKEYATILAAKPGHLQASLGLARIELQRGNDNGAVARLKDLVTHHPESMSAPALLGQVLERRGDADGAAAMRLRSQQAHDPVPPDPWLTPLLADCYDLQRLALAFEQYRLTGQIDEAIPLMDRLEEVDPKSWIPPMLRGWSAKQAGHYPEAVQEYRVALKNGGDPEKICPLLVAALLLQRNFADAAALLEEYHAKAPHSIPILLSYCEVAVKMKNERLARSLLTEVLQLEPYLYMPNMSMVQILWNAGERDAAAQHLQKVARVYPSDVDSRGLLGQYYLEKADPWSAIPPLEQAAALVQAQPRVRERITRMLGTAYLTAGALDASQGRFPLARDFAGKAIHLEPGRLEGFALLANICRHQQDFQGAVDAIGKIAALQPDNPAIQMSLGDVVYQAGDKAGALQHWQRALDLAPADARELRDALGRRLTGPISPETFQ